MTLSIKGVEYLTKLSTGLWWAERDSDPRRLGLQPNALPAELSAHKNVRFDLNSHGRQVIVLSPILAGSFQKVSGVLDNQQPHCVIRFLL